MKIPALLAANVLIVGAGILTYDVLRTAPDTTPESAESATVDLTAIEERLDELERRLDGVSSIKADRAVTSRLLQLEQRLASLDEPDAAGAPAEAASLAAADTVTTSSPVEAVASAGEIDVEKLKQAMEKLETDRDRERAARGVDRMIDRLGLQLTEDQKTRLADEFSSFRSKVRDNFRNGRSEGKTREDMIADMETMRDDFGKALTEFMPQADADAILEGMADGGGPGGGRRGGFGGPGGGGGIR